MDVDVGGQTIKVIYELFADIAPQTCENFRKICNGSHQNHKGEKLSYAGTEFHRIVKGMYVQAGNIKHGNF